MKKFIIEEWKPLTLGLVFSLIYLLMPLITFQVSKSFIFSEYLHLDAPRVAVGIKKGMSQPFSAWLPYGYLSWVAVPWFFILAFILTWVFRKTRNWHLRVVGTIAFVYLFLFIFPDILIFFEGKQGSISNGHVANGSMHAGKRVNYRGDNFTTYSFPLYLMGRTYAHDKVKQTILDAYEICESKSPDTEYILGEIGWKSGGNFLPHRTHQKGMSVDFMTPYLKYEKSFSRNHLFNLWGYKLDFDDEGNTDKYQTDFEAVAQHLLALKKSASKNGLVIQKVIYDPVLRKRLRHTSVWNRIKDLPYTRKRVVWRHDDHYHVDFSERKIGSK